MKIAISMALYRRVEETAQALEALRACPELAGLRLYASIDNSEYDQQPLQAMVAQWPDAVSHRQPEHLGCNANTRHALVMAFGDGADFVLHIEDDVIVSPDAGRYILWAAEKYRSDPSVFTVGLWRHAHGWLPQCGREPWTCESLRVGRQSAFTCWGWGTWRDRWEEIDAHWTPSDDHTRSWDVQMAETIRPGPGPQHRVEIAPLVSRARNIGWRFGTHRGHVELPYWQQVRTTGDYKELPCG